MEEANRYLRQQYLPDHNRRFSRVPASAADYHRKRPSKAELDAIFRLEEQRVISNDWVVQYQGRFLQIERASRYRSGGRQSDRLGGHATDGLQLWYRERPVKWHRDSRTGRPARNRAPGPRVALWRYAETCTRPPTLIPGRSGDRLGFRARRPASAARAGVSLHPMLHVLALTPVGLRPPSVSAKQKGRRTLFIQKKGDISIELRQGTFLSSFDTGHICLTGTAKAVLQCYPFRDSTPGSHCDFWETRRVV